VDGVLFVRELAGGRDLVLAFTSDGKPAWVLDLDSGLQWWFPGGESDVVRRAIAESWSSFATMPIAAASSAGPHPAVELGRRAEPLPLAGSALVGRPAAPGLLWLESAQRRLSPGLRPAVALAILLAAVVLVPVVVVLALHALGGSGRPTVDDTPTTTSAVPTAGAPCSVRGEVARDTTGHVFVCVAESRAMPSVLTWHASA
jgi:hypothetical protein